ncbi:right-handed parallel beta-helix repeat-containing protein [Caballeronia sp. LZ029]|uniref:right-handed parallel beta-helix repeat-containing protein n=1 Tax=Caballeronia sp. LZ029 TaxID=3038564 RepID=UPI00285C6295|nr:right-handed parallel beta-helix repeat-containing protein [Caballeronia sp. LZ029]MDR5744247.1 right-handed parallel beta-helix repeat-containing protein [Caballeronia sp. LZ029]
MNRRRLMLKSLLALQTSVAGIGLLARAGRSVAARFPEPSVLEAALQRSTGVRYGPGDLEVLDSLSDLVAYAGQASRVFLRNAGLSVKRQERFLVCATSGRLAEGHLADALGRTWLPDSRQPVDIRRFGPMKGGDCTASLERALAQPDVYAWIPPDLRCAALDVPLPSHATVVIDGAIEMTTGAPVRAAMFTNADPRQGNSHIALVGNGSIDGARARQASDAEHELIHFSNCSSIAIHLARAGGNRFSRAVRERSGAAIHLLGGRNHSISIDFLGDYGREGIWLFDVSDSVVHDTSTRGGDESWSGVQVGGPTSARNRIARVATHLAGASGIGCDSKESLVVDCSSRANAYFHGFNFGHAGQPADDTTGLRLFSDSAGTEGSASADFNGFSIVNGSRRVSLIDCVAERAFRDGFNTSAGADESTLFRCTASGSGRYGVNAYGATVIARNCTFHSNAGGSISPSGNGRVLVE